MTDLEAQDLRRENDYLKRRCAQLQADVVDLESQVRRAREQSEHRLNRRSSTPNPLADGQ